MQWAPSDISAEIMLMLAARLCISDCWHVDSTNLVKQCHAYQMDAQHAAPLTAHTPLQPTQSVSNNQTRPSKKEGLKKIVSPRLLFKIQIMQQAKSMNCGAKSMR